MDKRVTKEILPYITSIGLLIFMIIDPMGILHCKTGTCPVSPLRELVGWAVLYYAIAEVIFTPLILFKKKIDVKNFVIVGLLVVVSAIELYFMSYQYLVILNLFVLLKLRE